MLITPVLQRNKIFLVIAIFVFVGLIGSVGLVWISRRGKPSLTQPDLTILSFTYSPRNPTNEQEISFSVVLKNQGTGNAGNSTLLVRVDVDNNGSWDKDYEFWRNVGPLIAGEEITDGLDAFQLDGGTHKIEACTDPERVISESNKDNNCTSVIFTVATSGEQSFKPKQFVDEGNDWKKYSDDRCAGDINEETEFSIEVPENWTIENVVTFVSHTHYEFTGPQGWFQVTCGYAFGGAGCPKYSTIKLKTGEIECCLTEFSKGGEKQLSFGLAFLEVDKKTGKTFAFEAQLKSTPENRTLLDKILVSFELK